MLNTIFQDVIADVSANAHLIFRMFLASACGALVGVERSRRQKDAGIRTHAMVALGSALIMIVSKYGFYDIIGTPGINFDASRIASTIVSGIGFLGAGVIFVRDVSIKGLTTAAGIWTVTGVSMAIGAGQYTIGIAGTLMIIVSQFILHKFFSGLENTVNEIIVVLTDTPNSIEDFKESLLNQQIKIESFKVKRNLEKEIITLDVTIKRPRKLHMRDILTTAAEAKNVISLDY